ncbi:hypothetical protein Gotri_022334 [Gossypium trilobum]|uniref:Indole-3-acetic acid-amido synthetase GH3.17-like n=2 Tax=Gossypium TaxID=3633 RepID=A0A7J9DFN2_9ROSI|nr:hypothetical protein [Gossypium trilobum]
MATRNEFEDGLKRIEELTTNADQIQEEILSLTFDRIANGEPSNILLAESVLEFFRSSGTSGGQPKLIPVTAETLKLLPISSALLTAVMKKHFGNLDQAVKSLEFQFAKEETETPCGLKARAATTSMYKNNDYRNIISKHHTSPIEAIFCSDTNQSMYCQLLAGLIQPDEVVMVGSQFATALLRAIKFLEGYWKELCSNIRSGQISDWITDSGCKNAASSIMKPNPQLADSIHKICSCESSEGIIKKLWPNAKFIRAITTGVMSQYVETLEFYSGGLPLVSNTYVCSEAFCGINLEPLSGPSYVSYTFLPTTAFFESLPVNNNSLSLSQEVQFNYASQHEPVEKKSNNENIEPIDLVHVKLGQYYELLVTSYAGLYRYKVGDVLKVTGFHNNTPQFQFVGSQNVILSIDTDKTSEADLVNAVREAKTLLDPLGFILTGFTSYADTCSIPGHYVLFWELKAKQGNDSIELDPKIMEECCYRMEEALYYIYRSCRKRNAIAALEIRVVKQGSFDTLMDYYVSRGVSTSQYKTPSCIKSKEAINILESKVIRKFFSPKIPM